MSAEKTPRRGDRVRVTYEAEFDACNIYQQGDARVVCDDGESARVPVGATVEVLTQAHIPSQDPEGTVREEPHEDVGSLWVHQPGPGVLPWLCLFSTAPGNIGVRLSHARIAGGTTVIGAMPGTPAWEEWQDATLLGAPRFPGSPVPLSEIFPAEAEGKLHDLPQHERDALARQQAGARAPRVFASDGPEPPTGVDVLHDEGPASDLMSYLIRADGGWAWSPSAELITPDHSEASPWATAAAFADGALVEVSS